MTIDLNNVGTIFGILAGAATFLIFLFAVLRYIIRAETRELRPNSGSTIKDAVNRMEGRIATIEGTTNATAGQLDQHMTDSAELISQGAKDKAAIEARQDQQDQTIATLADAVKIAAQSTPPTHEEAT